MAYRYVPSKPAPHARWKKLYSVGWLGHNGRPELAAAHSILASRLGSDGTTTETVCDLNFAVKTAQDVDYSIKIWGP